MWKCDLGSPGGEAAAPQSGASGGTDFGQEPFWKI